jgi:hypothetical protein
VHAMKLSARQDFRSPCPNSLRQKVSRDLNRPLNLTTSKHNMSSPLQSSSSRIRPLFRSATTQCQQIRNASLIRRPKRPYTFTQLVTLSDGSSFMHRTTSPQPLLQAVKDVRNSPLWNPTNQDLMNVEQDEAGKLAAFRAKFGTAWDTLGAAPQTSDKKAVRDHGFRGSSILIANACRRRAKRKHNRMTVPTCCLI